MRKTENKKGYKDNVLNIFPRASPIHDEKERRGVGGRMSSKDRKSPARRRRRQRRRTMTTGARIGGFGHWARNSWTTVGGGGEPRETQPKYHRKKCVRTSFISQFYSSESVSLDRVCSPQRPTACMLGVIVTEQGRSARRQPSASQQLLQEVSRFHQIKRHLQRAGGPT